MVINNTPPSSPKSRRRLAEGMLVLATFFWGWTFPIVKDAIAVMPVFAFLAWRFAFAAALMVPIVGIPKRSSLALGLLLGVLLFFAFAFQTWGLALTSASKCAFLTALNVVWVAFLTARTVRSWLAVGLAVASLWLLLDPGGDGGINLGDWLTLICSLFIAAHIMVLARLDDNASTGALALIQFAVVAVLCAFTSLIFEEQHAPPAWDYDIIFAFVLTTLGATIFAFWAQTHFQRWTTPVRVGLIFILEPVFASIFAVLFYDERLSPLAWLGAVLILVAMVITARSVTTAPRNP